MKIAYGYDVKEDLSDPYVALANEALDKFSKSTMLGEYPVDFLPIRKPRLPPAVSCADPILSQLDSLLGSWRRIQEVGEGVACFN